MTAWRTTHVDAQRQRHVLHHVAPSAQAAQEQAEALYGLALYCACICIGRCAAA